MKNLSGLTKYNDMFNYCNRIKKINKNYELYYDTINKLFIILNSANSNEICMKFISFNLNLEEILNKTSIRNARKLYREIEENNIRIEQATRLKSKQHLLDSYKDLSSYSKRTNKILQSDINKILGVKYD